MISVLRRLRGLDWILLAASLLLGVAALLLHRFDRIRTDASLLRAVEQGIKTDLIDCVRSLNNATGAADCPYAKSCVLQYNPDGELISWTESDYLPPREKVDRLIRLRIEEDFLFINTPGGTSRIYVQLFNKLPAGMQVTLIPVYIPYEVDNNFLIPYVYLGRFGKYFNDEDFKLIRPFDDIKGVHARVYAPDTNTFLMSLKGLPIQRLREPQRQAILLCVLLAIGCCLFVIRRLSKFFPSSGIGDLFFLGVLIAVRILLHALKMPGEYVYLKVFSPSILAMDDWLAPSLGDFTLNVLLIALAGWFAYKNLFRKAIGVYRNWLNQPVMRWLTGILLLTLAALLLRLYMAACLAITRNSAFSIEFDNLFKTQGYSIWILLDLSILLLACLYVVMLLLKYHALWLRRPGNAFGLWAGMAAAACIASFLLCYPELYMALVCSIALGMILIAVWRMPHDRLVRFDLANYLMLLYAASGLTAYGVMQTAQQKLHYDAAVLADKVLEDRKNKASAGYARAAYDIQNRLSSQIIPKYQELENEQDFVDWLRVEFLDKPFKDFERRLYAYNAAGQRIDRGREAEKVPQTQPQPDSSIQATLPGGMPSSADNIQQVQSRDERFIDAFLARFELVVDSTNPIRLVLELSSNPYGTGSISPMVLINNTTYRDQLLFDRFDFAVYQDSVLFSQSGLSSFPVRLPTEYIREDIRFESRKGYYAFFRSVQAGQTGSWRSIMVRIPKPRLGGMFTTFSLIFYFQGLSLLFLLMLPAQLLRVSRYRLRFFTLPIRSKIRLALVLVSIFPILAVIVFLYPYINLRYSKQANDEIIYETNRVADLIESQMQADEAEMDADLSPERRIQETLTKIKPALTFDLNVYSKNGNLIASSQPDLFGSGISPDLMNARAFSALSGGENSSLVQDERLGRLEYLAGYHPLYQRNNSGQPLAFVNVPFLNKKEELNQQVYGLLAYLANIYLVAFLVVGFVAVVVSAAITRPLAVVQQRLTALRLGDVNQPIEGYRSEDEIGEIIAAYNNMVAKLSESEERLKATQRQMAWRQMARQVAHEIKNPLTPMRLSIQQLMRQWKERSPLVEKNFEKIMRTLLNQIDLLVRIANSFSEFAAMPEPARSSIDLREVVEEVTELYASAEGINWNLEVSPGAYVLDADRDQLSRAIGNVIKNGIQAMENGGSMLVKLVQQNGHALISIADSGAGIPPEISARIFEPNFSTKNSGMGLGLAMVKRIVENHDGEVTFETEAGKGATFYIRLPLSVSTSAV